MAGDRTLTLKILGDTKQLVDSLNKGAKGTESFTQQISDLSAKVVKSFVAIGAAVGAFSVAFAKAAAEDEQAANRLAQTLGAVTNATEKQISAVGRYITQTSLATGITDDELRPAFERLARSTNDVDKAQTLLNLSLDLSAATSKPLETVTSALGKAYDGNFTALNRLGLGIDQSIIKTKDFDRLYQSLNGTFGEFSERRSEEALVKFQKLQRAIEEAKEAVGAALLPAFERLGDWLLNDGVPRLNAFIAGLVGDKSLSSSFSAAQLEAEKFGEKVRSVIDTIVRYKDELIAIGAVAAGIFVASKIAAGVQATILLIKGLVGAYNALRVSALAAGIASAFALNPALGIGAGVAAIATMGTFISLANRQSNSIEGLETGGITATGINAGGGERAGGFVASMAQRNIREEEFLQSLRGRNLGGQLGGSAITGGFSNLSEALTRLQGIQNEVSAIEFKYQTGQLSRSQTEQALGTLQKEINQIEKIANSVAGTLPGTTSNTGVFRQFSESGSIGLTQSSGIVAGAENASIVINVNAPSVIDEVGFTRAVVDAMNSVERTSAGGYSALFK